MYVVDNDQLPEQKCGNFVHTAIIPVHKKCVMSYDVINSRVVSSYQWCVHGN